MNLLITCEHGGHAIPPRHRPLFRGAARALASHRGWDAGAMELAQRMGAELGAPLVAATVSRLLVDLNRSRSNPAVLSEWTGALSTAQRESLLDAHHSPHRDRVEDLARAMGPVLHVAVHTFTPVLRGVRRTADIGLLYDPARAAERRLCAAWRGALRARAPRLRVRMNFPYRGVSDGLTTSLRRKLSPEDYAGVELEVNQRLVRGRGWSAVQRAVIDALREVLPGPVLTRPGAPRIQRLRTGVRRAHSRRG